MNHQLGLAAATGAHTHVCFWNSTRLRDIEPIVELVRNTQMQGLPVTTEVYTYVAGGLYSLRCQGTHGCLLRGLEPRQAQSTLCITP